MQYSQVPEINKDQKHKVGETRTTARQPQNNHNIFIGKQDRSQTIATQDKNKTILGK